LSASGAAFWLAEDNGYQLGHSVRLWTPNGVAELPIVGLLEPYGAAFYNGGAVVIMPLAAAQRVFRLSNQVNRVQIVLEDGIDEKRGQSLVAAHLPAGLRVQTPSMSGDRARQTLYSLEQMLTGISLATLIAGAFVIVNTFLMNLTERRRQLAILRALGVTRGQLSGLLLREAALLGLAGTALGIGFGYLLAAGVFSVLRQVLLQGVPLPGLHLTNEALLLALLIGPALALAATWLPAQLAGRRAPLEDLLARGGVHRDEPRRWTAYLGLMLVGIHFACVVGLLRGWLPSSLLTPIIPIGIVGCVLTIPLVIRPLLLFAAFVLKWPLGLEARLASRQLARRPTRTSLTVGILSIASFVSIGVGHVVLGSVRDTTDWGARWTVDDYYVCGPIPQGGFAAAGTGLPEQLEKDLAQIEGVERVNKISWILTHVHGQRVVVWAYTVRPDRQPALDIVQGDPSTVVRAFSQGEAVVGVPLAKKLGIGVGDDIVLETPSGPQRLRIAGTANEHMINNMALHLEWNTAKRLLGMEGVHSFDITARPGQAAVVGEHLKTLCRDRHLVLQSRVELRRHFDQTVTRIVGLVWGLFALVFIVASLAVVNTLTMNVMEQTRELGILRALGLQRYQLGKLVLAQALTIAVVSLVPGTAIGLILAYLLNLLSHEFLAQAVPFRIDFFLITSCLVVVTVLTVIAALLPARRAARLQVVKALQHE
jgi:putative ABC transport system permease protein